MEDCILLGFKRFLNGHFYCVFQPGVDFQSEIYKLSETKRNSYLLFQVQRETLVMFQ